MLNLLKNIKISLGWIRNKEIIILTCKAFIIILTANENIVIFCDLEEPENIKTIVNLYIIYLTLVLLF